MLDDLSNAVKAQLHDRATSPLFGAFGLAWVVWNYRLIFLLFSDFQIVAKLSYIDTVLYPDWKAVLSVGVAYPLVSAILLIFIYPIPARYVYEYWRNQQKRLKEIRQRIDDETPLTREEAKNLRRDALRATLELEEQLSRRSEEVARLREALSERAQSQVSTDEVEDARGEPAHVTSSQRQLPDIAVQILRLIAEDGEAVPVSAILRKFSQDRIETEYSMGLLEKYRLARRDWKAEHQEDSLAVTHDGREYLVNQRENNSRGTQKDGA